MSTWSFKAPLAALALAALVGCDDGAGLGSAPNLGLPQAAMAFGAVTLVPPRGYCIDRRSLRPRFALMARCDTLGSDAATAGAPLGLLTASFSAADPTAALPDAATTATILGLSNVSAARRTADAVLFRASGPAPVEGMSQTHWRGTAQIGDQIMGLALYAPDDSGALGAEGRALLQELIAASRPGGAD